MSTVQYYTCPAVQAEEFRAHCGAYIVGVPQPTALVGLATALRIALQRDCGYKIAGQIGVAYGVAHWEGIHGISTGTRASFSTPRADASVPAPIDDRARATAEFSLIFEITVAEGPAPSAVDVGRCLDSLRLQGATLWVSEEKAPVACATASQALAAAPASAFFLLGAADALEERMAQTGELVWQAIASMIARPTSASAPYKPRWVPAVVGWRTLEDLRVRLGMRDGADAHAYAEPQIGLCRFTTASALRRAMLLDESTEIFWRHAQGTDGSFIARCASPLAHEPDLEVFDDL